MYGNNRNKKGSRSKIGYGRYKFSGRNNNVGKK